MGKISNKVALITGANKGIGKIYAKEGANLILCTHSDTTIELCRQLEDKFKMKAMFIKTDVAKMTDCQNTVKLALEKFGKINILVSNTGVYKLGNFLETSEADQDFYLDINVKETWNIYYAVLPSMVENKSNKIVIMSSVTGYMVADCEEVGYAMSKTALIGLTKDLTREFAEYGINVNAICSGYVDALIVNSINFESNFVALESIKQGIADVTPLKRLATPEEAGNLTACLGNCKSNYITETAMVIDYGITLPDTVGVGV